MTLLTYLMDKLQKLTENVFDYLAYIGYGYVYNSIYVVVICMHSDHLLCLPKPLSLTAQLILDLH